MINPDKTRRFKANSHHAQHQHAHFECTNCSQVYCLEDVNEAITQRLPKEFLVTKIHISINGVCANCHHINLKVKLGIETDA